MSKSHRFRGRIQLGLWLCGCLAAAPLLQADTLRVGPEETHRRIEDAVAVAKPGDVIEVLPASGAGYEKVAVTVNVPRLTIRAVPPAKGERVRLSAEGVDLSGKGRVPRAIFQFNPGADGGTLEGFELTGARNGTHNAAGVRILRANQITVRECDIHDNDMGVMSSGEGQSALEQKIEYSTIHQNGSPKKPGMAHNLYLDGGSATIAFCEIHHSVSGHNVKSRAHHTRIEYCYLHDASDREVDLVDSTNTARPESDALLLGNIIVKAREMKGNKTVIHFGKDGKSDREGTVFLVHNTIVTPYSTGPVVLLSTPRTRAYFSGNLVCDGGANAARQSLVEVRNGAVLDSVTGGQNWLSSGFSDLNGTALDLSTCYFGSPGESPGFVAPERGDWRLSGQSPVAVRRPPRAGSAPPRAGSPLTVSPLRWQYRHPAGRQPRPANPRCLGACEEE